MTTLEKRVGDLEKKHTPRDNPRVVVLWGDGTDPPLPPGAKVIQLYWPEQLEAMAKEKEQSADGQLETAG